MIWGFVGVQGLGFRFDGGGFGISGAPNSGMLVL